MKRNAKIVADDGENRIEVSIKFLCRNGLTRDEVKHVTRIAARTTAQQLKNLPYSDFGEENTRVKV